MNAFDVVMLILLGVLVFVGVVKGLTRILIGIGALVAAFLLAAGLHQELALRLGGILKLNEGVLKLIAYLVLFIGTMLVGALAAYVTRKLLKAAMLSWADRLAGGALGLVAAMLIAGLLVLPLVAYVPSGERALRESVLAPYVTVVADVAKELVPEELSRRYRDKMEGLRRYWSGRVAGGDELS